MKNYSSFLNDEKKPIESDVYDDDDDEDLETMKKKERENSKNKFNICHSIFDMLGQKKIGLKMHQKRK